MLMDAGMDTGPILVQRSINLDAAVTGGELSADLAQLGADLVIETLPSIIANKYVPVPQDDEQATYAPLLKKADGELIWNKPAAQLERQVRAYSPWPGSFFHWGSLRIQVHKAQVADGEPNAPALVSLVGDRPAIQTAKGQLVLEEIQPAGKQRMQASQWLRGSGTVIGSTLFRDKPSS